MGLEEIEVLSHSFALLPQLLLGVKVCIEIVSIKTENMCENPQIMIL